MSVAKFDRINVSEHKQRFDSLSTDIAIEMNLKLTAHEPSSDFPLKSKRKEKPMASSASSTGSPLSR